MYYLTMSPMINLKTLTIMQDSVLHNGHTDPAMLDCGILLNTVRVCTLRACCEVNMVYMHEIIDGCISKDDP